MKRLYWLIPIAIIAGIVLWRSRDKPEPQVEESSVLLPSHVISEFGIPAPVETADRTLEIWTAHTPLGKDRRPVSDGTPVVGKTILTHDIPAVFTVFDEWLQGHLTAAADEKSARLTKGRALLSARQTLWPDLARSNPAAALMLTPSQVARAALPPDMAAQLEQIVSGEGFYGVKAICNHEPTAEHVAGCRIEHEVFIDGRSYQASIYGSRNQRLTEESASIYGVALGGLLALHEDDVVILPATDERLALIHRGKTTLVSESQLEVQIQSLLNP